MMILVIVNECGEELEFCRIQVPAEWDIDMIEVLQDRKEQRAREEYPEMRGMYWEDRRDWDRQIACMVRDMF